MREVSILERLRHKNICLLKETFQDEQSICEFVFVVCDGFLFCLRPSLLDLVLEYIDGGDLLDYIIASGGLSEWHYFPCLADS